MKIKSHIKLITERVLNALDTSKVELINEIISLTEDVKLITKCDFGFWEKQLKETDFKEIPVTHFGIQESKRLWTDFQPETINQLAISFNDLLLLVLSYCNGESCEFQADYHYYVHIPTQKVFKESELGNTQDYPVEDKAIGDIRIARITELDIPEEELL